jgi:hypothetical protein
MIRYQKCSRCGKEDITGTMGCTNEQLCPSCAAKQFNTTECKVRGLLESRYDPTLDWRK